MRWRGRPSASSSAVPGKTAGDADPEELVDDLRGRARGAVERGGELGRLDPQAFGESDERSADRREERRVLLGVHAPPAERASASARPTAGPPAAGSRTAPWPPRCPRTRPRRPRRGSRGTRPANARARRTPAPTRRAARRPGPSAEPSPAEASLRTATTTTPTPSTNARCRRGGDGGIPRRGGSAGAPRGAPGPTDRSPDGSRPAGRRGSSRHRRSPRTPAARRHLVARERRPQIVQQRPPRHLILLCRHGWKLLAHDDIREHG